MPNTLTRPPSDILRRLLIALGLGVDPPGTATTWPIYATNEPDTPDNVLTVFDTAGTDDGSSMIDGELWGMNGFQVRVRASDYFTGWQKADAIQTALAQDVYQERVTISGVTYFVHACGTVGDVIALGKEPSTKRFLFTINGTAPIYEV